MRLSYLKTFVEVIKHQSISSAARELHLTQPAVTKQLKLIEEFYGVDLIKRLDNKIQPTREGKKLYGCALNILTENTELINEFNESLQTFSGHLNLIASNYPAHYLVPELISEHFAAHPNITCSLKTTDSQTVYQQVKDGFCPFGFVGIKKDFPQIECLEISQTQMALVGLNEKFNYLVDHPEAIKDQKFILRASGSATLQEIKKHLNFLNIERIDTYIECDNNEVLKTMLLAGIGIGYFFEDAIQEHICNNTLIVLDDKRITRHFYYIHNTHRYKSISENAFHTFILEKYLPTTR
jgi:DNA-binding transcriptional LysR family regulator